ncbi:MAG: hypothetical protein IPJ27_10720 [Candidatus Accumulibacter sp.]|uniref:Uncharacterized protein n=1 Tax=Candidatus Accumulibacter proximus TaxID=2954385 RepID=A0A935PZY6_9PROT|nr:hypothetical protein [Candidatus Accumulibacter proximus]
MSRQPRGRRRDGDGKGQHAGGVDDGAGEVLAVDRQGDGVADLVATDLPVTVTAAISAALRMSSAVMSASRVIVGSGGAVSMV